MAYPKLTLHTEGAKFVSIFAAITFVLFLIAKPLGWVGVILTGWCFYFFRNPDRVIPIRKGLIVSPADGIVTSVGSVIPPKEYELGSGPRNRISIFLNVFDVHVNRIPIGGIVRKSLYTPGKFLNASLDKASEDNERQAVVVDLESNQNMAVVQIAGLIARRIKCDVEEGKAVLTGQRYGIIRFGSRTDIYLPEGVQPLVCVGQRTIGGETVIADMESTESNRQGEIR